MIAIKSIVAGMALFAIVVMLIWLGVSFAEMEWQSINPTDWSERTRAATFAWLCICILFSAANIDFLTDKHK